MAEISLEEIREAIIRAKDEARLSGVEREHIDAVAAALAILELTGLRSTKDFTDDQSSAFVSLPETFAEWTDRYNISTHTDRFLSVIVYLYERGKESVTTADIQEMYEKARWKKPANAADVFAKGADKKLFAEAEGQNSEGLKLWRITRTGYRYFEELKLRE